MQRVGLPNEPPGPANGGHQQWPQRPAPSPRKWHAMEVDARSSPGDLRHDL